MIGFKRLAILSVLLAGTAWGVWASVPASAPVGPGNPAFGPRTGCAVKFDLSKPLRDMIPLPPPGLGEREGRPVPNQGPPSRLNFKEHQGIDPVVQTWRGEEALPAPIFSMDGIPNIMGGVPPDTQGDVGPNHYVQWINVSMVIISKTGTRLWGPYDGNAIWTGFGGPVDDTNCGDPVVLYDRLADRWLISQFAFDVDGNYNPIPPYYEYIAVSQTPDPTGAWYRYAFETSDSQFTDYPKLGVWPDGYYMSVNEFSTYNTAVGVYVFDRAKMLAGDPTASFQMFDLGTVSNDFWSLQPSHLEGSTFPTPGEPNTFVQFWDSAWGVYPDDSLLLWNFHVDWNHPAATTFGLSGQPSAVLETAPFDSNMCYFRRTCIPQPDTGAKVDAISDRLMYRVQYRRFPTYKTLVLNHTVDADGTDHAGVRWYELRDSGSGWSIYQQGTYAPDSDNRWMASAGMDKFGNIAVGYSISSPTTYPGIRYAGRVPSDPLGTLGQGEQSLKEGAGSQTITASDWSRWGDYSTLSVDPSDDCTFWYTQEYYQTSSDIGWHTRIGAFRLPGCGYAATLGATPTSGSYPLSVSFTATVNGGVAPFTYAWTFGDGTTGSGASTSHTYTQAGTFNASCTVTDSTGASTSSTVTITVTVAPPVISTVQKLANPFRLKVTGTNFHNGCTMTINGTPVPVTYKNSTSILAKGTTVKALVPKGVTVSIVVTNPDDGGVSAAFSYTR